MKIKYLLLLLIALFSIESAYCQNENKDDTKKKVKLNKHTLAQDSTLSTWDLIVSTPSLAKANKKSQFTESAGGEVTVSLSTDDEKGIIYVDFNNLPEYVKPELSISNKNGDVIYKHKARFANNAINMRKLPSGTYLFAADVDEVISIWEFVKE